MVRSSTARIRFALVGIFSLLALGFLLSPGTAQPGRLGGRPPAMPRPPSVPPIRPPSIPPIRPPSMPGGFATTSEWRCSGCKALVGVGPVKPAVASCPSCGARFTNSGFGGFIPPPAMPETPPPSMAANADQPAGAPPLPTNPAFSSGSAAPLTPSARPAPDSPPGDTPDSGQGNPSDDNSTSDSSKKSSRVLLWIIGSVLAMFFVLGAAVLGMVVLKASSDRPVRRRKKALDLDDED